MMQSCSFQGYTLTVDASRLDAGSEVVADFIIRKVDLLGARSAVEIHSANQDQKNHGFGKSRKAADRKKTVSTFDLVYAPNP
jgi:hypothetical protein